MMCSRRRFVRLAGGLTLAGMLPLTEALADSEYPGFVGTWVMAGHCQPCSIVASGHYLLVVNEHGSPALAEVIGDNHFRILYGRGWQEGLVAGARSGAGGDELVWFANGVVISIWRRPAGPQQASTIDRPRPYMGGRP